MSRLSSLRAMRSMRAMFAQLITIALAFSLVAVMACEDSGEEVAPSPTSSPPSTDPPQPDPTSPPPPIPRPDLEERLDECAAEMADGDDPAETFSKCLKNLPYTLPPHVREVPGLVTSADGPMPLVLIDVPYGICQSQKFIAWQQAGGWSIQSTDTVLQELERAMVTSWPARAFESGTWV